MFSKSSKSSRNSELQTPAVPAKSATPSLISADLHIVGDMHSQGEIQIDGAIDGNIRTHSLLVGEGARIIGEITADSVIVHGNVTGQIKARSVELAKSAHVIGDILHEDLAIETGAFLEGHCKRVVQKKDQVNPTDKAKSIDHKEQPKTVNA
jgi:cytoskeletal protein CcmA (bactofilin family)